MTWDADTLKQLLELLNAERAKATDAIAARLEQLQQNWHHRFVDFEQLAEKREAAQNAEIAELRRQLALTAKTSEIDDLRKLIAGSAQASDISGLRDQLSRIAAKVYIGVGLAIAAGAILPLVLHRLAP